MENFARHGDFRYIAKFPNFSRLAKFPNFAMIAKFSLWLRNFRNPSEIFAIIAKFYGIAHCILYCISFSSLFHCIFVFVMPENSFNLHGSAHISTSNSNLVVKVCKNLQNNHKQPRNGISGTKWT